MPSLDPGLKQFCKKGLQSHSREWNEQETCYGHACKDSKVWESEDWRSESGGHEWGCQKFLSGFPMPENSNAISMQYTMSVCWLQCHYNANKTIFVRLLCHCKGISNPKWQWVLQSMPQTPKLWDSQTPDAQLQTTGPRFTYSLIHLPFLSLRYNYYCLVLTIAIVSELRITGVPGLHLLSLLPTSRTYCIQRTIRYVL